MMTQSLDSTGFPHSIRAIQIFIEHFPEIARKSLFSDGMLEFIGNRQKDLAGDSAAVRMTIMMMKQRQKWRK